MRRRGTFRRVSPGIPIEKAAAAQTAETAKAKTDAMRWRKGEAA
jgi:hypothetical protein